MYVHLILLRVRINPMRMTTTYRIATYFDQLDAMALLAGVDLKEAFEGAGVPTSTYYRAHYGADLRAETANKVAGFIRSKVKRGRTKHAECRATAAADCPVESAVC